MNTRSALDPGGNARILVHQCSPKMLSTVATLRFSIGCNRLQPIEKYSVSPTLWP